MGGAKYTLHFHNFYDMNIRGKKNYFEYANRSSSCQYRGQKS